MRKAVLSSTAKYAAIKRYVNLRHGGRKRYYKRVRYKSRGKIKYKKVAKYKIVAPTASERRQVSRYYKLLFGGANESGLFSDPRVMVTVRGKRRREIAEQYAQIPPGFPKLKGVLIPVASDGDRPILTFRREGGVDVLDVTEDHVKRSFYAFEDFEDEDTSVLENPLKVAKRIIGRKKKKRLWKLACGKHQSTGTFDDAIAAATVRDWYEKYDDAGEWCTGMIALEYASKKSIDDYLDTLQKRKKERRQENRELYKKRLAKDKAAKKASRKKWRN